MQLVGVLLLSLMFVRSAMACTCMPPTPAQAHAGADAVVFGRIVSLAEVGGRFSTRATVEVRKAWKATVDSTIQVATGGPCDASMPLGDEQLLFLARIEGGYSTEACSGNQTAEGAGVFLTWLDRNARRTR